MVKGFGKMDILLIDDNHDSSQILIHFVKDIGAGVVHAESFEIACKFFVSEIGFDFIIMKKEIFHSIDKSNPCYNNMVMEVPMLLSCDKTAGEKEEFIKSDYAVFDILRISDLSSASLKHRIKTCQIHFEFTTSLHSLHQKIEVIHQGIKDGAQHTSRIERNIKEVSQNISEFAKRLNNDQLYFIQMHEAYLQEVKDLKNELAILNKGNF